MSLLRNEEMNGDTETIALSEINQGTVGALYFCVIINMFSFFKIKILIKGKEVFDIDRKNKSLNT